MPPQIALLLCILLVLCLFRMDSKRRSGVSSALWIPLIWVMIIGSRSVAQWLNPGPVNPTAIDYLSGNPIDRTIFAILIATGVLILLRREIDWAGIRKSNAWIFLFFFYCGISITWSDFPFVSFKRWVKEIGNFIMVLVILTDPRPTEAVKTVIRRCAYLLIPLSVVLIKYYPHLSKSYGAWTGAVEFMGVTTSKNMLGNLCLVFGMFFFWSFLTMRHNRHVSGYLKNQITDILVLVMIFWLLMKSSSVTSLAASIIGIGVIIGLSLINEDVKYIGIYISIVAFLILFLEMTFKLSDTFIVASGRDLTLTGRTDLWKDVINMGTSPLIGTGYESFWLGNRLESIWANHPWQPNQAHNGYLETYLNLGVIGLSLLIGVIVSVYRKIRKALLLDCGYARFRMAFLAVALVNNIAEGTFKGISLVWFIFLLIATEVPRFSQLQLQRTSVGDDLNL